MNWKEVPQTLINKAGQSSSCLQEFTLKKYSTNLMNYINKKMNINVKEITTKTREWTSLTYTMIIALSNLFTSPSTVEYNKQNKFCKTLLSECCGAKLKCSDNWKIQIVEGFSVAVVCGRQNGTDNQKFG